MLNTSSQYFSLPNESSFDLTTAITIALFAKHDGAWVSTWEAMVTKGDSSWRLSEYEGDGGLHWATDGMSTGHLNWSGTFDDGAWHSVVATLGGGEKRIILDGTVVAEITGLTGSMTQNDNIVCIGENNGAAGRYFKGWMNDVRIYNRGLSVAEAQAFHAMKGGDDIVEGLLARYLCNEGVPAATASTLLDSTGANNATGNGSPTFAEDPHFGMMRRSA